jgi:hypothetical protein
MVRQGHAVDSVCQVLREQGCAIAARTFRAHRAGTRGNSARTRSDAAVVDAVRAAAFTVDGSGRPKLAPEGLYGRVKMHAHLHRSGVVASFGAVDRAMRTLGLAGVRRHKKARTTWSDPAADRAPGPGRPAVHRGRSEHVGG